MSLAESDLRRFAHAVMNERGPAAKLAVDRRVLDLSKHGLDDLAREWRQIGVIIDRLDVMDRLDVAGSRAH